MMILTDEIIHRSLIGGLVGKHQQLYVNNATFKVSVDHFASLIPVMVDAMAEQAMKVEVDLKRMYEEAAGP